MTKPFAVLETRQVDQRPMADDAAASVEASESPETSATPETVETELKRLTVLPAEAPTSDEPASVANSLSGSFRSKLYVLLVFQRSNAARRLR